MIDASLARRLVDSQFPQWSDLPIAAVELDGWDNRTFRLGSELTVRLPSGDWYARQVAKEQRWLPVLAPRLPLPIPTPVALGEPGCGFPYPWSVYRWLEGEVASQARIDDLDGFATALARFLVALGHVDATGGPGPGRHNWFRGGPLATYEGEALEAIDALGGEVPRRRRQAGLGRRDGHRVGPRAGLVPRRRRHREPAGPRRAARRPCSTSARPASAIPRATR